MTTHTRLTVHDVDLSTRTRNALLSAGISLSVALVAPDSRLRELTDFGAAALEEIWDLREELGLPRQVRPGPWPHLLEDGKEKTPFQSWLLSALDQARMTQAEAARRVGVTTGAMACWVHGRAIPAEQNLTLLEAAVGVRCPGTVRATMAVGVRRRRRRRSRNAFPDLDFHRADILEALRRGVGMTEVARRYAVGFNTLKAWLAERGIEAGPPPGGPAPQEGEDGP